MDNDVKNYPELKAYLEGSDETKTTLMGLTEILKTTVNGFDVNQNFVMLDVGCSDGELTLPLINNLKKIIPNLNLMAIEPESAAYQKFIEKVQNLDFIKHENIRIQQFLRNQQGKKDLFNFIMFSQSFYHFHKKEWKLIIESANQLLGKNGFIAIILDSHQCEAYKLKDLITNGKAETLEFGDLYSAEDMEKFLKTNGIKFKTFSFPIYLYVKADGKRLSNCARHLSFLYRTYPDRILPKYENKVRGLLENNKKNEDYYIRNLVKVVLFQKQNLRSKNRTFKY